MMITTDYEELEHNQLHPKDINTYEDVLRYIRRMSIDLGMEYGSEEWERERFNRAVVILNELCNQEK